MKIWKLFAINDNYYLHIASQLVIYKKQRRDLSKYIALNRFQ